MRKGIQFAVVVALCGVSSLSFGASLASPNLIPLGPGGYVEGVCSGGSLVSVQQLENFQTNVVETVKQVGKAVNTGQMQQMSNTLHTLNQDLQELVQSKKELAKTKAVLAYQNQIGGLNASSSSCQKSSGFGDTLQGAVAAQASAAQITAAALSAEQPVANPVDTVKALSKATAPTLSASSLIPVGDTAATASAVSSYIQHVVTPLLPQAITAQAKSTPSGTQYQALHHLLNARASLATVTLGAIAKENLPDTPDALAQLYWKKAGLSGPIPGEANGKVSQNGLLDAMSYRYLLGSYAVGGQAGSPNHGDAWMLREYATEMAGQLHAELEEEQFLEHAVALQASMLGATLQKQDGRLNNMRAAALQQAANAPASSGG